MEETTTKNPIQLKFFEKLKHLAPANISLANEIADVLEISADGAYRRMRGESVLSMDEMVKLCRHYKIPPDAIVASDENTSATFQFRKMIQDESGFEDYLKNIYNDLQRINASHPKQIIYAASDIPIFHQFYLPEYAAFKMYWWQKAILNLPSVEGKKFDPSEIRNDFIETCKRITDTYIQIPSIEIWHNDTFSSNLAMLDFAWESGWFDSKEKAFLVCDSLTKILNSLEKQAEKSSKFIKEEKWAENEGNFTFYHSEVILTNNHIFVTAGNARVLYLTHNTFNSMATTNKVFCDETESWLKNLMKKSTQISGMGEKQRHKFFKKCHEKVSAVVTRISES
ncbi:MAG: hypothetical protein HY841_06750 [Bacteroidetes bacterium]|nr:hypothetical protein [Bacteroidota bacterium]